MLIKRFSILFLCCIIAFCPLIALCDYSYAENESSDIWSNVSTKEETVAAWKAYLNSRNIAQKGNPVSALITWDYDILDGNLKAIGSSMEELQSGLFYTLRNEQGLMGDYLRFRYSTSAWSILNQVYSKFALQNSLGENENDTFDKNYKSGEWFEDDDGNGCYVFIHNNSTNIDTNNIDTFNSLISSYGSKYRFEGLTYYSDSSIPSNQDYVLNYNNGSQLTYTLRKQSRDDKHQAGGNIFPAAHAAFYYQSNFNSFIEGFLTVSKSEKKYYLSFYDHVQNNNAGIISDYYSIYLYKEITGYNTATNSVLNIATDGLRNAKDALGHVVSVNPKKKDTDEGYSSLEEYLEDDTSEAEGSNTDIPDNDINTPEEPSNPSAGSTPTGGFQLPDGSFNFRMPELNINWSLDGLQNKFPLSIPWDMIRIASALDTTAATPEFDFTVNFTRFTHRFQFDLHAFDTIMGYFRIAIEVLYTFGLIVATRQIFHIY